MQAAVIPLSVNLDKILDKLNGTNKDKKIRRKDMENIFDDIVNGEAGIYSSLWFFIYILVSNEKSIYNKTSFFNPFLSPTVNNTLDF